MPKGCVDSTTAEAKWQILRTADPKKEQSYIRRNKPKTTLNEKDHHLHDDAMHYRIL